MSHEQEAREAAGKIEWGQQPKVDSGSVISVVTGSGRKSGVEIKRFEPSGNNKLRVWLENVPFNNLVNWLDSLEKAMIFQYRNRNRQSGSTGLVNGRLTLGI